MSPTALSLAAAAIAAALTSVPAASAHGAHDGSHGQARGHDTHHNQAPPVAVSTGGTSLLEDFLAALRGTEQPSPR